MSTALPDVAAAIKLRLASFAAITALVPSNKILLTWPRTAGQITVPAFTRVLLIQTGKGGPGELPGGRFGQRVDILCYGTDERTADELWRTVHYAFCPPVGAGSRHSSFTLASCQVNMVRHEAGPMRLVDRDTGWPYVLAAYIVDYSQTAVT